MHLTPQEAVNVGLYRHVSSEHASAAAVNWRPTGPVIGREFAIEQSFDLDSPARTRAHRYAAAYLAAFLILASLFAAFSAPIADYPARISYNVHSPVFVDGDADLLSQAASEGWGGTGSASDPVEIRDYEIDGSGTGFGVVIINTRLYVNISSCYIYGAYGSGIDLQNATNATVVSCILESCGDGVHFYQVFDSTVADTQCSNSNNGMYLDSSGGLFVSNVTCDTNIEGVYSYYVTGLECVNSSFSGNSDTGIWLESSDNAVFEHCQADYNDYGFYATDCYWTMLANSTCIDEGTEGVYVESSTWFQISNNTITGTYGEGVYVDSSFMFLITNNNLSGNNYGAYLYNSQEFGFQFNNISYNSNVGVGIDTCEQFGMRNNSCYEGEIGIGLSYANGSLEDNIVLNSNYGVYALWSDGVYIGKNDFSRNSYGIYIEGSSDATIWNNTCSWCTSAGIYAYSVTSSSFTNNNCSNGTSVLLLVFSDYNMIQNNVCSGNSNAGIDLEVSNHNTVQNNRCEWNTEGIYLAASTDNAVLWNWCNNNYNTGIQAFAGSDRTLIDMNTVTENEVKGILVDQSMDAVVTQNFCRSNPEGAIALEGSLNATLAWNMMVSNGVWLTGGSPENWYSHHINQTNIVNGRPVVYIANQTSILVAENAGQILVANCDTVMIDSKALADATVGLEVGFSRTVLLNASDCGQNLYGAYFYQSQNFAASNSSFVDCNVGFLVDACTFLMADNNTFSGGTQGVSLSQSSNAYVKDNVVSDEDNGIYLSLSSGAQIWRNTCDNCVCGVTLVDSTMISVHNNSCESNSQAGIYALRSDGTRIENNMFQDNVFGIHLFHTGHCDLIGNTMVGNGIYIQGYDLEDWNTHSIPTSNTVNGRPVYYIADASSSAVPNDGGQIILANCDWMTVNGGNLTDASVGLSLGYCEGTSVQGVDCSGGNMGVLLDHSSQSTIMMSNVSGCSDFGIFAISETGDTIRNNTICGNRVGVFSSQTSQMKLSGNLFFDNDDRAVWLGWMSTQCQVWNNTFAYNNGALDNSSGQFLQAYDEGSSNTWYEPLNGRGNYWNDWTSPDSTGDGIVDNPYLIEGSAGSRDMYPLVAPMTPFEPIPQFGVLLVIPLAMLVVALLRRRRQ